MVKGDIKMFYKFEYLNQKEPLLVEEMDRIRKEVEESIRSRTDELEQVLAFNELIDYLDSRL
jgi:hypothetical protein